MLAVLVIVLAIYQRQRVLQHRAMEHEERSSIYEPPITYMAANFRQNTPYHEVAPRGRPSGLVS